MSDATQGHHEGQIAAELERLGWQPIETVPKDGREVLLAVALRAGIPNRCLVGHWMSGGYCIEDHPPIDAGFYFWNGCMFDKASEPLCWMALPSIEPSAKELERIRAERDAAVASEANNA